MSINKYNSEGYNDPTAYAALTKYIKKNKHQKRTWLLYTSVRRIREILQGILKTQGSTADLYMRTVEFHLHRIYCSRNLWMIAILQNVKQL